jgi:hypothetical protein
MQTTKDQQTQSNLDREFIQWAINQYLAGKIDADDFLSAVKTVKPATGKDLE